MNPEANHALEQLYADAMAAWASTFDPDLEPVTDEAEDALFHALFGPAVNGESYPALDSVEAPQISEAIRDGFADARPRRPEREEGAGTHCPHGMPYVDGCGQPDCS